jgi:signal transduction histidine kinase
VLAVVTQIDVWAPSRWDLGHVVGPRPLVGILYAVTSLLLLWRRRAAVGVLAVICALDTLHYLVCVAPDGLGSFLPILVAFYSVGRYARTGAVTVAAPLVLLGAAVHDLRDPTYVLDGPAIVFYGVLAAAWPLGHALRRAAEATQRAEDEAAAVVRAREERTRSAVTAERSRISRELHDVVGHGLSVVVLQLVAAGGLLDREDVVASRAKLDGAERSARQALDEMRRLLDLVGHADETTFSPQPGLEDLSMLVSDTRQAGAEVHLRVEGRPRPVPAGLDLAAYRIVQEALTNVVRHAHPPRAEVVVGYRADGVCHEIVDEGGGTSGAESCGRGLAGIRERVALYGGTVSIGSDAGGFKVRAHLPVTEWAG